MFTYTVTDGTAGDTATVTVTVNPAGGITYEVLVSLSSDRSAASALDGQTVSGNIFVFSSPDTGVVTGRRSRVLFFVDGAFVRSDGLAPFDLAGGTVATALPFDTTTLANGQHTITVRLPQAGGGTAIATATFTVAN